MKFPAYCRHCNMRIEWSTTRRSWDRRIPNTTYDGEDQLTKCALSKATGFHDPDPKRA